MQFLRVNAGDDDKTSRSNVGNIEETASSESLNQISNNMISNTSGFGLQRDLLSGKILLRTYVTDMELIVLKAQI